jgi:hypothetical protein
MYYTTISLYVQELIMASNINKQENVRWNITEYLNDLRYKNGEIGKWRH